MDVAGVFGILSSAKQIAPRAFCSEDADSTGNTGKEKFAFRKTLYEESLNFYIAVRAGFETNAANYSVSASRLDGPFGPLN